VPETRAGDGAISSGSGLGQPLVGGGEGAAVDPVALPEPLGAEAQNAIIRAGYAREPKASIAELAAATGLKNSTVKMRAKALGLSDPQNQKAASRRLMEKINEERRAGA
jgi:hypothetical protein